MGDNGAKIMRNCILTGINTVVHIMWNEVRPEVKFHSNLTKSGTPLVSYKLLRNATNIQPLEKNIATIFIIVQFGLEEYNIHSIAHTSSWHCWVIIFAFLIFIEITIRLWNLYAIAVSQKIVVQLIRLWFVAQF